MREIKTKVKDIKGAKLLFLQGFKERLNKGFFDIDAIDFFDRLVFKDKIGRLIVSLDAKGVFSIEEERVIQLSDKDILIYIGDILKECYYTYYEDIIFKKYSTVNVLKLVEDLKY